MRDQWDARYKELVQEVLRGTGEVLVGLETTTPTQRMDVVYRPDAAHRAARLQRGLLGRLTDAAECNIEPYRNTPSVVRVRDDLRRVWGQGVSATRSLRRARRSASHRCVAVSRRTARLRPSALRGLASHHGGSVRELRTRPTTTTDPSRAASGSRRR
jgi:hypothetical protein